MRGMPVGVEQHIAAVHPASRVRIRIGNWPSGLYFALLRAPGGRVGYAPFVLAPARLGEHRIAVVMPTQTWQAYNFRDDNGDGKPDTWYATPTTSRRRGCTGRSRTAAFRGTTSSTTSRSCAGSCTRGCTSTSSPTRN